MKLPKHDRASTFATMALLCMALAVMAGCASPAIPLDADRASTDKIRLVKEMPRTVSGVEFIDCAYASTRFDGVMATYWFRNPPRRNSPPAQVQPGGRGNFIPIGVGSCPRTLTDVVGHARDAQDTLDPAVAGDVQASSTRDTRRLQTDAQVALTWPSKAVGVTRFLAVHKGWLEGLAQQAERMSADRQAIAERGASADAGMLRQSLDTAYAAVSRLSQSVTQTYSNDPPPAVAQALAPLDALGRQLRAGRVAVGNVMDMVASQQQARQDEQAREAEAARLRRNRTVCDQASRVSNGGAPSESAMCHAMVDYLEERAAGYAQVGQLMASFLGPAGATLTGSLRANLSSFARRGECRSEPRRPDAWICRYDLRVSYADNAILQGLQRAGLSDLHDEAVFWKDGDTRWRSDLTPEQKEALERSSRESDARQKDAEKRERQRDCFRAFGATIFGGMCYAN